MFAIGALCHSPVKPTLAFHSLQPLSLSRTADNAAGSNAAFAHPPSREAANHFLLLNLAAPFLRQLGAWPVLTLPFRLRAFASACSPPFCAFGGMANGGSSPTA